VKLVRGMTNKREGNYGQDEEVVLIYKVLKFVLAPRSSSYRETGKYRT
jgi:hypothetical protein